MKDRTLITLSLAVCVSGILGCRAHEDAAQTDTRSTYRQNRYGRPLSEAWRYGTVFVPRDLPAVRNNNPLAGKDIPRLHPKALALSRNEDLLYVAVQGTEQSPRSDLHVLDLPSGKTHRVLRVGRRPIAIIRHPNGHHAVVINELSNYLSLVDLDRSVVLARIPADYYCQSGVFSANGSSFWVSNRYLGQVLRYDVSGDAYSPEMLRFSLRRIGGFSDATFLGNAEPSAALAEALRLRGVVLPKQGVTNKRGFGGVNAVLRARCGTCHAEVAGGLLVGPDPVANFLSAAENSVPGEPDESPLLRAVLPRSEGGFGDAREGTAFHKGGALLQRESAEYRTIASWILAADRGPGIPTGNEGAHPHSLVLSSDERWLFAGNTGTQDIAVISTATDELIGAIYVQNAVLDLAIVPGKADMLVVATLGAGFGAARERDPHGGETWERASEAAQFSILRDPSTTDPFPIAQQAVLGPFDAVDGTANSKMRDIQNDLVAVALGDDFAKNLHHGGGPTARLRDYTLLANRYEALPAYTRYTSDTAEATTGDVKGDIPPELMRVPGAFPEALAVAGHRLYALMSGSFELVSWNAQPEARDPSERLVPLRVFGTGLLPRGFVLSHVHHAHEVTPSPQRAYIANELADSVTVLDLDTGKRRDIALSSRQPFALSNDAERGALIVHSAVFSSDGDTSCVHCHIRDTGDGRGWGAAETVGQDRNGHLTHGGTLGIPQMRNVYAIQPYYFEGTHLLSEGQGADINEPASSIDFDRPIWAGDFTSVLSKVPLHRRRALHEELKERVEVRKLGAIGYDLEAKRSAFIRSQSQRYFGRPYELRDLYRFVGAWLGEQNHLLPNPYDQDHPAIVRGRALFNDPSVMCGVCHVEPEFTNKSARFAPNERRALPPLTTITRRDASYTLASVHAVDYANGVPASVRHGDKGRVEAEEGSFTTMQLRGLFDRPPAFLHHGRARSLREVVLTPGHYATRSFRLPVLQGGEVIRQGRRELGFNERRERTPDGPVNEQSQIVDTHGGTSHLTARQVDDLVYFMLSIE